MAQQIKLRRGPVSSLPSVATAQGELLLATGSISDLSGPFITMTGTAGTGTSTIVGKIYEGTTAPSIAANSVLTGTPFYATGNNTLYRLNHAGNEALDLSGNLENTVISNIIASGSFSGSFVGDGSGLTGITATGLDIDNFGSDLTGITIADTDKLAISDGGTEGRINASQVATYVFNKASDSGDASIGSDGAITINATSVEGTMLNTNVADTSTIEVSSNTLSVLKVPNALTAGGGLTAAGTFDGAAARTFSVNSGSLLPFISSSVFGTVSGDILISSAGVASIQADSVALGTDTTGDYVANLGSGTGVTIGSNSGEGSTPTISVDYGSLANTAVQGNTTITINGTTDEIEVTGTAAQALGGDPTYTIGLPDDVTVAGTLTAATGSIQNDLTVGGNLYVQGTTTTIDSTTVQIGDNIIELNGSGATNGGIKVNDATNPDTTSGSLLWDTTNDYWKAGQDGSEKEIALLSTDPTTNLVQKINASGHLVDSTITDNGTDVSLTGELTIQGLTADSFVVTNGSSQLLEVTPSTAGDLVQWNGSSFVASNVIDGGTF